MEVNEKFYKNTKNDENSDTRKTVQRREGTKRLKAGVASAIYFQLTIKSMPKWQCWIRDG